MKSELLNKARNWLRVRLRGLLQQELNALCAGAFSISVVMLLKKLWEDMPRLFGEAVAGVVVEWAREMLLSAGRALAYVLLAILAIVAVVLIILALPEIAAAAAAVAAELAALAAALIPVLIRFLPEISRLLPELLPE